MAHDFARRWCLVVWRRLIGFVTKDTGFLFNSVRVTETGFQRGSGFICLFSQGVGWFFVIQVLLTPKHG